LVYARATGWGQDGPWCQAPGHDINFIAVTGALNAIGRRDSTPPPPLNLVGDYGGGGMLCAVGVLAALLERVRSGKGQVIDAAMVDGVALLTTLFHGIRHIGRLREERESNNIDGGAPWYDTYECSDGKFIAVGGGEPPLFEALCDALGLAGRFDDPMDRSQWDGIRRAFAEAFSRRSRDEWASLAGGPKLCLSPVLTWAEAPAHEHLAARHTYVEVDKVVQPGPAPRFSRTSPSLPSTPPWPGEHTDEVVGSWGVKQEVMDSASKAGAVRQRTVR
jgi:alpha-methylacyl-CoA racemase